MNVSGSMIGQWENDLRKPKNETIDRIASAIGQSFYDVVHEEVAESERQVKAKLEYQRSIENELLLDNERKLDQQFIERVNCFVSSPFGKSIIDAFFELNEYGQEEASERILELTFLPQFSINEVPAEFEDYVSSYLSDRYANKYIIEDDEEMTTEPPEPPTEGNTTPTQEKPSEGQTAPTDGK